MKYLWWLIYAISRFRSENTNTRNYKTADFALSPRHKKNTKTRHFCKSGGFLRFCPSTQLTRNAKIRKFNGENTTEFNFVSSPTICVFSHCRAAIRTTKTRHYSMCRVFAFSLLGNVTNFRIVVLSSFCPKNKKTRNYKTEGFLPRKRGNLKAVAMIPGPKS